MASLNVIVLAAGDSTRLKSQLCKVMHPICGRPMIDYVLDSARSLKPKKICVVLGHGRETVLKHLNGQKDLIFIHQRERLGTAHAAQVGLKGLGVETGPLLILNGDVPLLTPQTLKRVVQACAGDSLTLLTALLPDPTGYGRIIRDGEGYITGIIEEKNATPAQREINEVNAGVYRVEASFLKQVLKKIKKDPIKKEYYLTEIVTLALQKGLSIHSLTVGDPQEILGANTRAELAFLNQKVLITLITHHLAHGIGMQDPDMLYLDWGVKVGEDTFLGAGVQLYGKTQIGRGVVIESGCIVKDSRIGEGVHLKAYSYLEDCQIHSGAVVGPFARIRPGSIVKKGARVGNFVELKKTHLGEGSKANHLSYLGDTVIGKKANIGAGTITCNYDGQHKYKTTISDGAFIGSDAQLVAPVKVGKGAYVGAGTTVTKNVPSGALALSRVEQKNIRGYVAKKNKRKKK